MENVLDFANDHDVGKKIQNILRGAKSKPEVLNRLKRYTIIPKTGEVFSVQSRSDGFDVLFLIGSGKRPRTFHCIEKDFNDFV